MKFQIMSRSYHCNKKIFTKNLIASKIFTSIEVTLSISNSNSNLHLPISITQILYILYEMYFQKLYIC